MSNHERAIVIAELSGKILKSNFCKFLLRFFPSFKRRIKKINKLAIIQSVPDKNEQRKLAAELKPELYSGERQVADSPEGIRKDHLGRYYFATQFVTKNDKVLDAACGIGYGSFLINQKTGAKVTGIDISQETVDYANATYRSNEDIKFFASDILKLDLPLESFDVVTSFETIEHVAQDKEILQKFHGLLKSHGILICSTPNEEKMPFDPIKHKFHIKHFTPTELKKLLNECNFEIVEIYSQHDKHSREIRQGDDGIFNIVICKKISAAI